MNRPIRRVAAAVGVLMLALFLNLNYVQVVKGDSYRDNPNNQRVLLNEYSTPRGQIIVGGIAIAQSVPTNDEYKYLRQYPMGPEYADILGWYSLVYGKNGIEDAEDAVLSGTDPRLIGSRITDILTGRNPRGGSVVLTLNSYVQDAAYKALGNRRGAVVAIDPRTGAILAAVSTPSFDPNSLSSHNLNSIVAAYKKFTDDPAQPLENRAFQEVYPPGSMFKVVVAAAALKAGYTPDSVIDAPRQLVLPDTGGTTLSNFDNEACSSNGKQSLADALAISCNTAFAELGMNLGESAIENEAALFGIDNTVQNVPLTVARSTVGPINSLGDLAHASIGQQSVRITPLEAAMMSAAVANGGTLMQPYLVQQLKAPDLSVISQTIPQQLSEVLDSGPNEELAQMMQGVVSHGTGTKAQITDITGVTVAGKTGTADTGVFDKSGQQTAPHDWFTGFANLGGVPEIAVAVIIENGGNEATGGLAAAPVAQKVMEEYLSRLVGQH